MGHGAKPTPQATALVDELGFLMETTGWSRMEGRVLGQLMLGGQPSYSQADLARALHSGVPAVSVAVRKLIQRGLVERLNLRGIRRDQFRVLPSGWDQWLERALPDMGRYRDFAERAMETADSTDERSRETLKSMRDHFAFWERQIPALVRDFVAWRTKRPSDKAL